MLDGAALVTGRGGRSIPAAGRPAGRSSPAAVVLDAGIAAAGEVAYSVVVTKSAVGLSPISTFVVSWRRGDSSRSG